MLEAAAFDGLSRYMIRRLTFAEKQKIGVQAAKRIVEERGDITIVDTHALIRTGMGFCPGLPKEVLRILSPKALVWIECHPSLIVKRRMSDVSRKRDEESEQELGLHQELVRSYLAACSMETGALLCSLSNNDPLIETNCLPLIRLIDQLSK